MIGRMIKPRDLTGEKFGRLTVISFFEKRDYKAYWLCQCTCGNKKVIRGTHLTGGKIESCRCLNRERFRASTTTHGGSRVSGYEPLFKTWQQIRARCMQVGNVSYKNYGGRGITLCPRWMDYAKFREDVSPLFRPGLSIDRIDNSGNYEPGNVRWATPKEQARNRRSSTRITMKGITRTLAEWAEVTGMPYSRLHHRIFSVKWPIERALAATFYNKPVSP